jgi:multimeric flavodoxin WrbA
MTQIVAIYGSPRRAGNTARLLGQAVAGAREAGATVHEIVLRDLKLSPCLEIYGCTQTGECAIRDDFQAVRDVVLGSPGLILASPIFFYTVSAHMKIFMDRFQSQWVKKYWVEKVPRGRKRIRRRGLFIAAGATGGRKLFDGALLTVKYFFDVIEAELWQSLLFRQLDYADDVLQHPAHLEAAREAGRALARELITNPLP